MCFSSWLGVLGFACCSGQSQCRTSKPACLQRSAALAHAWQPLCAATCPLPAPPWAAGRTGRPPLHPDTAPRTRQRKLSFGASFDAVVAVAAGKTPRPAVPLGQGFSPLEKLEAVVERQASGSRAQQAAATQRQTAEQQQLAADGQTQQTQQQQQQQQPAWDVEVVSAQLNKRQRSLAAVLSPADLEFGFSLPSPEEAAAERAEEARLLASMPRELRRYSTDGIISFDTLRVRGREQAWANPIRLRAVAAAPAPAGSQPAVSRRRLAGIESVARCAVGSSHAQAIARRRRVAGQLPPVFVPSSPHAEPGPCCCTLRARCTAEKQYNGRPAHPASVVLAKPHPVLPRHAPPAVAAAGSR